jgi:hypothetical protein
MENIPRLQNIGTLSSINEASKKVSILGVLGIEPSPEVEVTHIDDAIVQGRYFDDYQENEVLISIKAAELIDAKVGEELLLNSRSSTIKVTLVGLLDDTKFDQIKDIDTEFLIPQKLVFREGDSGTPVVVVESCDSSEVIVMDWQASKLFEVFLSRVDVQLIDPNLTLPIARQIALERDLWVWSSFEGQVHKTGLGEYMETKGHSIMIPWVIVILNVVIIMLNAIFDRRREISILSSVGLNPSHIGSLFMAEAAIIGIIGGGVGYLLGLGGYQVMSALSIVVEVRQKVSVLWSLASQGVAVAAVLVGAGIAIKNSVSITPSTLRRWTMERKVEDGSGSEEFQIPIRLNKDEVDPLLEFVKRKAQERIKILWPQHADWVEKLTKESEEKTQNTHIKTIDFNYAFGQHDFNIGRFPFRLIAEKKRGEESYTIKIVPKSRFGTDPKAISSTVTFIRMLVVDWSARTK